MKARILLTLALLLAFQLNVFPAADTLNHLQRRNLIIASSSTSVIYAGSMIGLYKTWYKDQSSGEFHFFNDLPEWKGMDKLGHFTTAWWIAHGLNETQKAIGLPDKSSLIRSAATSLAFMSTIEIFDGFSSGYGFSVSDMGANLLGVSLFAFQELHWGEQRILARYSYHNSPESLLRPELLGSTLSEKMLKNYNGQNYWLSFPVNKFSRKLENLPSFLCLSLGYGVSGLYGARDNSILNIFDLNPNIDYSRKSMFYLSFDIDLQRIPIRGKAWKMFTSIFRWVKFPAPSLALNKTDGFKFYPIYW